MPPKYSILIVEDESSMIELITDAIKIDIPGCECHSAPNGNAALAVFSSAGYKIDLIITDLQMPYRTGFDLIKEIRKSHPKLPCILITGQEDHMILKESLKLEMIDVFFKPFAIRDLVALVKDVVTRKIAV